MFIFEEKHKMLFLLGLLALAWQQTLTFDKPQAVVKFTKKPREPGILNYSKQQRSMVAQDHTTIRAPMGGNETAIKQMIDYENQFIHNKEYQQDYQLNIRNVKFRSYEARLPQAEIMNERNKFATYSLQEATFQKINDYWNKQRNRSLNWQH